MQRKPIVIKRGNVSVKIYFGETRVNGRVYPQHTVTYYSGNKRVRKNYGALEEAKAEAELIATKLANGENDALKLTSSDRAIYVSALEDLKPLNVPLTVAVSDYVAASQRLPSGVTIKDAVDFFLRRNPSGFPKKTVEEVTGELIAAKTQAGRSELHIRDLESRLGAFGRSMQMPISEVTGSMIQAYLDGLKFSGRTRRNHLRHISTLFRFATRRKYLTKDALEELEAVEKPEVLPSETLIFTPGELREMLSAAPEHLVPQLAIGAFCGLRSAELLRLDWAQVNLERRFVEVKALNAKTASRRLVPLCDAAVAWLTPHIKKEGRVAYYAEENKFHVAVVEAVNEVREANSKAFNWKKNALRHSFCSYRLAVTHDMAKTSLEAGNSAGMILKHYRELVTEDEGQEWFGVMPKPENNVLPLIRESQAA